MPHSRRGGPDGATSATQLRILRNCRTRMRDPRQLLVIGIVQSDENPSPTRTARWRGTDGVGVPSVARDGTVIGIPIMPGGYPVCARRWLTQRGGGEVTAAPGEPHPELAPASSSDALR
jgi:hypothetical protein